MVYINYAFGILFMIILFSFFQWVLRDLKTLAFGKKRRKVKKNDR